MDSMTIYDAPIGFQGGKPVSIHPITQHGNFLDTGISNLVFPQFWFLNLNLPSQWKTPWAYTKWLWTQNAVSEPSYLLISRNSCIKYLPPILSTETDTPSCENDFTPVHQKGGKSMLEVQFHTLEFHPGSHILKDVWLNNCNHWHGHTINKFFKDIW